MQVLIPNPTDVRKLGSTSVDKNCSEEEARIVCKQMAHDPRVAAQYYHAVRGKKDAKKAFDTISAVRACSH